MKNTEDERIVSKMDLPVTKVKDMRWYKIPSNGSGNWVPSVTTVVNHKNKAFFEDWRKRTPNSENIQKAATTRGDIIHYNIEQYLLGHIPSLSFGVDNPEHVNVLIAMQQAIQKITNIRMLEGILYSDILKMAGRVDCVAEYEGELSIIDFKGSNKPKKDSYIQNYFEQTTAYALMYQDLFDIPIKQVVVIVGVESDNICQVFKKRTIEYVDSLQSSVTGFWTDMVNVFNLDYKSTKEQYREINNNIDRLYEETQNQKGENLGI